jgi:hypothetical protein
MLISARSPTLVSVLLLATAGCGSTTTANSGADADADGYTKAVDCDDLDPSIHPDQAEPCACDGIDQDCNGIIDDFPCNLACLDDLDGDGYASPTDCNDEDATIHPGAEEPCACDGIDQNCNGDPHDFPCEIACVDADMDGFPEGIDCNDNDPTIHPDPNPESCLCDGIDQNCNGIIDDMPCDKLCTYLQEGEVCTPGTEPACGVGLACCYPCGIDGCDFVCVQACSDPGCSGGCPPPPP